jgi:hypothetical protein
MPSCLRKSVDLGNLAKHLNALYEQNWGLILNSLSKFHPVIFHEATEGTKRRSCTHLQSWRYIAACGHRHALAANSPGRIHHTYCTAGFRASLAE